MVVCSVIQETGWALLLVSAFHVVCPFYVPGVAPQDFRDNEPVDIKVSLKAAFHSHRTILSHLLIQFSL